MAVCSIREAKELKRGSRYFLHRTGRPYNLPRPSPSIERWISFLLRLQSSARREERLMIELPCCSAFVPRDFRFSYTYTLLEPRHNDCQHFRTRFRDIFLSLFSVGSFHSLFFFCLNKRNMHTIYGVGAKCCAFELQGKQPFAQETRVCNWVSI